MASKPYVAKNAEEIEDIKFEEIKFIKETNDCETNQSNFLDLTWIYLLHLILLIQTLNADIGENWLHLVNMLNRSMWHGT